MGDTGGRMLRVYRVRGAQPSVVGRLEEIRPRGEGLALSLATQTGTQWLGSADIDGIDDLDTGETVAGNEVGSWLWRLLLDDEVDRHGGVRLATAIDALSIPGLGPALAASLARRFESWAAFEDCARRAAAETVELRRRLTDETILELLRYHSGNYGGRWAPTAGMLGSGDMSAMMTLMEAEGVERARALAVAGAVLDGSVDRALATVLAGRWILGWRADDTESRGPLANECLVFTGTLKRLTRAGATAAAERAGATVGKKITEKTTLLVASEDAGSKLDAARERGLRVIGEEEFAKLVGE